MVVKLWGMYGEQSFAMTALDYAAHEGHMEIVRHLALIPVPSSGVDNTQVSNGFGIQEHYLSSALLQGWEPGSVITEGANINFLFRFGTMQRYRR